MYGYTIYEFQDYEVYVLFDGRSCLYDFYLKHKDFADLMHMFGIPIDHFSDPDDWDTYSCASNNIDDYIPIYLENFID